MIVCFDIFCGDNEGVLGIWVLLHVIHFLHVRILGVMLKPFKVDAGLHRGFV